VNIWIVVVNYNGWDDTRKCLQSLKQLADAASVVLIDNASRENQLAEFQAEFPWCHMVHSDTNGGWAGGNNLGMKYALERGADWMLLLNNDTTVAPNLIGSLRDAVERHPSYGVLGPVICYMDQPEEVMTDGCVFNHSGYNGFFERKPVALPSDITDVEIVNGCALFVSRKVTDAIGLVDEAFFLIHEESDFCLRAREAGFGCGVLGEKLVWHKGSSTFKQTGSRIQRYYDARNLRLLLSKHNGRHAEGRTRLASSKMYWKYVYYRYCVEKDNRSPDSARAVLEGVCDGLAGHYGPLQPRRRLSLPLLRGVFNTVRTLRGSR